MNKLYIIYQWLNNNILDKLNMIYKWIDYYIMNKLYI